MTLRGMLQGALALSVIVASGHAFSQSAPVAPDRLATLLPTATWADMTRGKVETESATVPTKRSEAKVTFEAKRGSTDPFRATFSAVDEGASMASMYAYGADYLTKDVKEDTQRSLVLPGGRRALLTSFTKDSMDIQTFVGKRFILRTSCTRATEAQCIEAFSKWDFKAGDALKP